MKKRVIITVSLILATAMLFCSCANGNTVDNSDGQSVDSTISTNESTNESTGESDEVSTEESADASTDTSNESSVNTGGDSIEYGVQTLFRVKCASITYQTELLNCPIEYAVETFDGYDLKEVKIKCDRNIDPEVNASVFEVINDNNEAEECYALDVVWTKEGEKDIRCRLSFKRGDQYFAELCDAYDIPENDLSQFNLSKEDILNIEKLNHFSLMALVKNSMRVLRCYPTFQEVEDLLE